MAAPPQFCPDDVLRTLVRERIKCEAARFYCQLLELDRGDPPELASGPRISAYQTEMTRKLAAAANTFMTEAVTHGIDSVQARKSRRELGGAYRDLIVRMAGLLIPAMYAPFRQYDAYYDKFAPVMPRDAAAAKRRVTQARVLATRAAFDAEVLEFELANIDMSGSTPDLVCVRGELARIPEQHIKNQARVDPLETAIAFVDHLSITFLKATIAELEAKIRGTYGPPSTQYAAVLVRKMQQEMELQVYLLSLARIDNPRVRPTWMEVA